MTEYYKARYSQAIPGVNRTDDSIRFSQAEKCIPHFGDGLSHTQKLTADASVAESKGRNTKIWCESLNRIGENGIRQAFRARDSKLRQWREHLNKEIDKLADEIENAVQCQTLLLKKRQYFSDMLATSETTSDFRRRLERFEPNDQINNLLREEQEKTKRAENDMTRNLNELKECESQNTKQAKEKLSLVEIPIPIKKLKDIKELCKECRQMQKARNALMSEAEAKSLTINIGKRCQHAEPLLNFPYIPSDHPVDQIYHPQSEDDWEQNLIDKIQNSVSVRKEASNSCDNAMASVKENEGETADAWFRTSKALQEAVQDEERTGHNITNLLKKINQDIASASQRIAYFFNDLKVQDRVKNTQLWRLQTMTFRPGHDHIRDAPIRKLDEEVSNIERKTNYVTENLNYNKDLIQRLNEEKIQQTLELERVSRKLFIEKENCLGIRRTVKIQGVDLDDYIYS